MFQRLLCLIIFILSLGFASNCSAELVGWWKLDEASGNVTYDSAGNSDGTIDGATWVNDPERGWVPSFNGSDSVTLDLSTASPYSTVSNEITVAFWMYGYDDLYGSGLSNVPVHARAGSNSMVYVQHPHKSGSTYWYAPGSEWVRVAVNEEELEGLWSHWAFTKNAATGEMKIYQNGTEMASAAGKTTPIDGTSIDSGTIGIHCAGIFGFHGMLSDVRIYDSELSEDDIGRVMAGEEPMPHLAAYEPTPTDGAVNVSADVALTWMPGDYADKHDVYLGADFNDVNNADTNSTGIYRGRQDYEASSYIPPEILEFDRTYYWRIDEVNESNTWKGEVWSFSMGSIPITDPNLIGWWKLDGEGSGTAALDWSGYYHDGTIMGDPEWVAGYDGNALELDGDGDYVDIGSVGISGTDLRTIAGWAKASTTAIPSWATVFGFAQDGSGTGTYFDIEVDSAGNYVIHVYDWHGIICAVDTQWHHFAITYDGSTGASYLDGQLIGSQAGPLATVDQVRIGGRPGYPNYFRGLVDDVRIYNKALTQEKINEIMRGGPKLAWDPSPANGSTVDIIEATSLSWSPGDGAASHDVYFGTDRDTVANANISSPQFKAKQPGTTYSLTGLVEFDGGTYCWRIDEVEADNATVHKGRVWSFTVANYLIVDDFEDYNDSDRIFQTWIDGFGYADPSPGHPGNGTGSQVGHWPPPGISETTITRPGSSKSMPFYYDNDGYVEGNPDSPLSYYSEAAADVSQLEIGQDWTKAGVKALTLYFYGAPTNDANATERMYVALEDGSGHVAVVPYDGDANDVKEQQWQEWNMALQDFNDGGVDLTNIKKIYIGFGDRDNHPNPGGSGIVYFDDVRLYPTRCVSKYGPKGDITDDCAVNFLDFTILASGWLDTDYGIEVVPPDPARLVGWWKFDEGSGHTAVDSAGNSNGTVYGAQWVNDPERGWVVSFDATETFLDPDYVDVDLSSSSPFSTITSEVTVTLWQRGDNWNQKNVAFDARASGNPLIYCQLPSRTQVFWYVPGSEYIYKTADETELTEGWSHWAFTKNATTGEMQIYRNGLLWHTGSGKTTAINGSEIDAFRIGAHTSGQFYFGGMISDLRIYDCALAQTEVRSVMGLSELYFPITSRANLYDDEPKNSKSINFNDLAILAEDWLEQQFWP